MKYACEMCTKTITEKNAINYLKDYYCSEKCKNKSVKRRREIKEKNKNIFYTLLVLVGLFIFYSIFAVIVGFFFRIFF